MSFTAVESAQVSVVSAPGKMPTSIADLAAAGLGELSAEQAAALRDQCFQIDLTFGDQAVESTLLVYLRLNVLRSILCLHGSAGCLFPTTNSPDSPTSTPTPTHPN